MSRICIKKLFILFNILSMLLLTSCGGNTESSGIQQPVSSHHEEMQTDTVGYVEHGPAKTNLDEKGNPLPYEYNGKEFVLDYRVRMGGDAEYMGFLLFMNGKPQKFTFTDEEKQYCNYIKLEENKENYDLELKFSPTVGKKDDTLLCSVVSIFNAKFKPDMVETLGYGINQSAWAVQFPIHYNANAVLSDDTCLNDLISGDQYEQNKLRQSDIEDVFDMKIEEMQDGSVYSGMLIDGQKKYDSYDISRLQKINIQYGLIGKLDTAYRVTFYLDNIPIHSKKMQVEKNKLSWMNVSMNVKSINKNTSFYAIAVPASYNTLSDREQNVEKTSSILLYCK